MIHRKINHKDECVCGSKMFWWKGQWFCKEEFVRKAGQIDKVEGIVAMCSKCKTKGTQRNPILILPTIDGKGKVSACCKAKIIWVTK